MTRTFQRPKGTRDFYPADMAVHRYLQGVWRDVSVNHGYDEIEGPTFEHLELYTAKSGEGIVNELFSFRRAGGEVDYALRPEFTPTLARMVAARAAELPRPIKWFCIPNHFRAERPQRGRLREFVQWNADLLGDDSPNADTEVIAVSIGVLERFGLSPQQVKVKISHRGVVSNLLMRLGVAQADLPAVFDLLDRRDKIPAEQFNERAAALHFTPEMIEQFDSVKNEVIQPSAVEGRKELVKSSDVSDADFQHLVGLSRQLEAMGIRQWCEIDFGIVRGLAYYTGTVFEIHETTGKERAIAGGGRYDNLVEQFGGPPTPAVGIAMGDVVIRLVLEDHGLLEPAQAYLPRPDVFVISTGTDKAESVFPRIVTGLRQQTDVHRAFHVRHSYRATRNVGKLLGDAGRCRARFAVILGEELDRGNVMLKNLDTGEQIEVPLQNLPQVLHQRVG